MATRRSPQKGSGPRSEATNTSAPAPANSDRFSQLEKHEIRDGTTRDVLEELRRLSYEIETINRRFDEPAPLFPTSTIGMGYIVPVRRRVESQLSYNYDREQLA